MIIETTLRELINSGVVQEVVLVGESGGFSVLIKYMNLQRVLANTRGGKKLFASLNTAVPYFKKFGIEHLTVDSTNFEPGRLRGPRPDRSAALKMTRTLPKQQNLIEL